MKYLIRGIVVILFFYWTNSIEAQPIKSSYKWLQHPAHIAEFESLIQNADQLALAPKEYSIDFINHASISSAIDSNRIDSLIHQVAIHFFSDLHYGSRSPNIDYLGVTIKKEKVEISKEISSYLAQKGLKVLVNDVTNATKEVAILLTEYNKAKLQDKKDPKKLSILYQTINNYRWLNTMKNQHQSLIVVNIPSASLHVYDGLQNPINMKMVVGKKSTPTKTLTSIVHQVIVNPFWNVPKSIATKELLPIIQKDRSYIETAHLQVLNQDYKIINAQHINWSNYNESNFPFYLRQSTGCDNSLGVVKLDFDSPFGIYLHDTPEKSLFKNANRFYSHGCMRMEKPLEVAKWVMRYDSKSLDTIDFNKCSRNPAPIRFTVPKPVTIIVWYNLIDFDNNFNWSYYKDVYGSYTY
jgi:murein L,D-transpeptidase YcbB/YkuD